MNSLTNSDGLIETRTFIKIKDTRFSCNEVICYTYEIYTNLIPGGIKTSPSLIIGFRNGETIRITADNSEELEEGIKILDKYLLKRDQ